VTKLAQEAPAPTRRSCGTTPHPNAWTVIQRSDHTSRPRTWTVIKKCGGNLLTVAHCPGRFGVQLKNLNYCY